MTQIIVSIITGLLTLAGVCVTAWAGSKKTRDEVTTKLETAQAVTDTKLAALTEEVRKHNNFAMQIPELRADMRNLESRVERLENKQD